MTTKLKGFKSLLPTKICVVCGREFQYRKKWKEIWSTITICSAKCKTTKNKNIKPI